MFKFYIYVVCTKEKIFEIMILLYNGEVWNK